MANVQDRLDKHDRQIAAIRDLVREGMRLMVETRRDLRALAVAQKRTEETLQAFLSGLKRGNGNGKNKADIR